MHGVERDLMVNGCIESDYSEISILCESHSPTVRRVEKKIGFASLGNALREIIES
jgi:hypothetical protein